MIRAYSYLRMSSAEQIRGDSLRRQLELSKAYAEKHSLTLVEDLRDIGISAFRGANAAEGALAGFLQAVRAGKVEPGSYLLIESLDRLSRQQVFTAFTTFSEIISSGINVVTLSNEKVYDSQPGLGDLIMSIVDMERAHSESQLKSVRSRAAWDHKRKNAGDKIVSQRCPGWLRPKGDLSGFDVDEVKARVVNRIFTMAAAGMGSGGIVIRLNKEKVPTFRKKGAWYDSLVKAILRSRAVIGEIQLRSMIDGKRVPAGEVKTDYYPRVIPDDLFYAVQQALDGRRSDKGGRKGARVGNVFSKIIRCGQCGAAMHMVNRGLRGGTALMCSRAKAGAGCDVRTVWKYPNFERAFLQYVKEVGLSSLSSDAIGQDERVAVERDVAATEGRLTEARRHREKTYELIMGDDENDFLASKLKELSAAVTDLEARLVTLRESADRLARESSAFSRSQAELTELIDLVQGDDGDVYALRSSLAARLRDLIKHIFVWSGPVRITILEDPMVDAAFAAPADADEFELDANELRDWLKARKVRTELADKGAFSVIFKNNINRLVAPGPDGSARVIDTCNGRIVGSHAEETAIITKLFMADLDEQLANRDRKPVRNTFGSAALIDRIAD
jgi:DNA invertase Pin-like site-specific DNA recombinase